jgi:hypothetical protein
MINPICKNPICGKEITTKNQAGKIPKHCSIECRYASPRGGKQHIEQPPICHLNDCDNQVSWHKDKRVWNKYCCNECANIGRSIENSKTKKLQNSLKPKIEKRVQIECSAEGCSNITFLRRKRGTIYAYCSVECRNKGRHKNQKVTFLEKYGVEFPMQNLDSFQKQQKSGKKLRKFVFKSGHEVNVRGDEPKALKYLEEKNYTECDITVDLKKMPRIWYVSDKKHRYYPDIYIEKENLIIEVKSTFTYERYLEKNLLKRQACLDSGYNFKFMIFDKDGNLLDI